MTTQNPKPETQNSDPGQGLPQFDPRLLAAMQGMALPEDDEIDLLDLWRTIWRGKWLIIGVSFVAALLSAWYSLTLPNIYRAEALLAPVGEEGGKGGGLSAALGGLGGLASMAGISLPGGGNVEQNLAVLKSREFLWKFIGEEKLMPILFADAWDAEKKSWKESDPELQPSRWDAYRTFNGLLSASADKKSGLVTVAIDWTEPEIAAAWANRLVESLNEHLRRQAIERSQGNLKYLHEELARTQVEDMRRALFELISQQQKQAMLANTQQQFAFRVLDAAAEPDRKAKPKRSLIVILAALVAGFLAVVFVLIREGIKSRGDEVTGEGQES